MKRDITVWLGLAMVVVPWSFGMMLGMPGDITSESPVLFHVFFWLIFVGFVRSMILWFQTLIHGVKYAKEENRVAVVMGHLFLGSIMAYGYYWSSRIDAANAVGDPLDRSQTGSDDSTAT